MTKITKTPQDLFPAEQLNQIAQDALEEVRRHKIDTAEVALTSEQGFLVTVRKSEVETLEHHQEKSFSITVYNQQRTGTASTSDLSTQAITATIIKACTIAQFTSADEFSGLADKEFLALNYPDLELFHHWDITPTEAIDMAVTCESIAMQQDQRITQSEGVSVGTYDSYQVLANTSGFSGHYALSKHNISCGLLAEENGQMERDGEYTIARRADELDDYTFVAKHAAQKTVKRLGAKKIKTVKCPVIFYAPVAKSLLRSFIAAISGGNLYRKSSFLVDQLGKQVFPEHVHIFQRPHVLAGIGSAPFDDEGVKTTDLDYVKQGILTNYVLGSYSARKLGLRSTGNAGGIFNLQIQHSDCHLQKLLNEMGRGLLVTELMGQGVRILTGDYSRGAFGYWVENGEIQYPVHEITIAGNLKDMFAGFVKVANDVDSRGSIQTGSILIDRMMVAGQ